MIPWNEGSSKKGHCESLIHLPFQILMEQSAIILHFVFLIVILFFCCWVPYAIEVVANYGLWTMLFIMQ
jgi:hypothetical protein